MQQVKNLQGLESDVAVLEKQVNAPGRGMGARVLQITEHRNASLPTDPKRAAYPSPYRPRTSCSSSSYEKL